MLHDIPGWHHWTSGRALDEGLSPQVSVQRAGAGDLRRTQGSCCSPPASPALAEKVLFFLNLHLTFHYTTHAHACAHAHTLTTHTCTHILSFTTWHFLFCNFPSLETPFLCHIPIANPLGNMIVYTLKISKNLPHPRISAAITRHPPASAA